MGRVVYRVSEAQQQLVDLKRIHAALQGAFLVASILPRVAPAQRLRRVEVSEDLDAADALERYVENHPELEHIRDDMRRCAAALEAELAGSDTTAGSAVQDT